MRKLIERWSLRIRLIFVLLKNFPLLTQTNTIPAHLDYIYKRKEDRNTIYTITKDTEIS